MVLFECTITVSHLSQLPHCFFKPPPQCIHFKKRKETNLPELLRSILPRDTLQDLSASGVLVDEIRHIVDVLVDDDVEALVGAVVRGDVGGGEGLGHFGFVSLVSRLVFFCLFEVASR